MGIFCVRLRIFDMSSLKHICQNWPKITNKKDIPFLCLLGFPFEKIFFQYYIVLRSGQVKSPSFIFPPFFKILVSFYCQSVEIFMKINLCWIVFSFEALYGKTQVKEQENISIDFSTILTGFRKNKLRHLIQSSA